MNRTLEILFCQRTKVSHLVSASPSNLNQLFTSTGGCCYSPSPSSDFLTLTQQPFKRTANKHQTFCLNLGTTMRLFQCVCKFSTFVTSCFHWWPQTIILGRRVAYFHCQIQSGIYSFSHNHFITVLSYNCL